MIKRFLIAFAVLAASPALVSAQDVFLSFGQGANVSSTGSALDTDGTGSAYLFVRNGFDFDAVDLDFFQDDSSVIQFTGGQFFNSFIPTAGATRFTPNAIVPFLTVNSIADGRIFATSFSNTGIQTSTSGSDSDFDAVANAFLLARLDYNIIGQGTVNLTLEEGSDLVTQGPSFTDGFVAVNPTLAGGTLTVTSNAIPEPSSATLIALGALGLFTQRRRA